MSESTLTTTDKNFPYSVKVDWHTGQGSFWWNDTCALVLEVFGLPGNRFCYTPSTDHMTFKFKSKQDENLCRILLSERL